MYSVLLGFADDPCVTIGLTGGDSIEVADYLANNFDHFRERIVSKYQGLSKSSLIRLVNEIDEVLIRRSLGNTAFDKDFWSNEGFKTHNDWMNIRKEVRAFLLR